MRKSERGKADAAIASVVLLTCSVAVFAIRQIGQDSYRPLTFRDLATLLGMFVFVTFIDLIPVRFPQLTARYDARFTVSDAIFLAASVGYGPIFGLVCAALSTLLAEIVSRRELRKLIFNVAQFSCAAGVSGLVYSTLVGNRLDGPLTSAWGVFAGVIASLSYLFVNSSLFAYVVGVAIGRSPLTVFAANAPGFLLQSLTVQSIGLLLASARNFNALSLLVIVLPLLGPYIAMRGHRDTLIQIQKTIEALADTVDRRDLTTAQHSERVATYTQQIIDELGTIGFAESEAIILAARVHDLGKIAIPDAVLLKPGKLDEGEYWLMRQHPIAGDDILRQLAIYKDSLGVVRHHHERYDGGGYPDGIKGEEIPLGARIVAVADSYDVMTSDRPYARARTVREAKEELIWCKGTHFDPRIVDAFVHVLERQHASESPQSVTPVSSAVSSPVA